MAKPYDPLAELEKQVKKAREARNRRMRRIIVVASIGTLGGLGVLIDGPDRPGCGSEVDAPPETLYAQQKVTVRSSSDAHDSVVRILNASEPVAVVRLKGCRWVRIFEYGQPATYAFRTRATLLPVRPELPPPSDTMAVCTDSVPWFSPTSGGACHGHHGVLCWIDYPPPVPARMSKPYCKYILSPPPNQP